MRPNPPFIVCCNRRLLTSGCWLGEGADPLLLPRANTVLTWGKEMTEFGPFFGVGWKMETWEILCCLCLLKKDADTQKKQRYLSLKRHLAAIVHRFDFWCSNLTKKKPPCWSNLLKAMAGQLLLDPFQPGALTKKGERRRRRRRRRKQQQLSRVWAFYLKECKKRERRNNKKKGTLRFSPSWNWSERKREREKKSVVIHLSRLFFLGVGETRKDLFLGGGGGRERKK